MAVTNKGLTIAHLNVRGLLNKVDQIRHLLNNYKFKILHISETFLTTNIVTNLICISGYNIVRRDRKGQHGGGLVSYVHNSIPFTAITDLDKLLPESLSLLITLPHSKAFITTAIYRPPNSPVSWTDNFDILVTSAKAISDELILLGDFNIDLKTAQKKWSNSYKQLGLNQLIDRPTRVQKKVAH